MRDAGGAHTNPLPLVHSINAAASAAEVKPLFEHYAADRPVVALELPGFGSSDRPRIVCTPRWIRDRILRATQYLADLGLRQPLHLMSVSVSHEIAARAASKRPVALRRLAFVCPTGFESRRTAPYDDGRTKDEPSWQWSL